MTEAQKVSFINEIGALIVKECQARGYKYPSAIIAQACLESGFTSKLATQYHNYFGMKCGKSWKGKAVNLNTSEYKDGKYDNVSALWRCYDSMTEGVKGYFDFIKATRYQNLLQATSWSDYIIRIGNDGYYTAPIWDYTDGKGKAQKGYLTKCEEYVKKYNLTKFDDQVTGNIYYGIYEVTCSSLRVRALPSLTATQVTSYKKGTKITPRGKKADVEGNIWYETGLGWCCGLFHGIEYLRKLS